MPGYTPAAVRGRSQADEHPYYASRLSDDTCALPPVPAHLAAVRCLPEPLPVFMGGAAASLPHFLSGGEPAAAALPLPGYRRPGASARVTSCA